MRALGIVAAAVAGGCVGVFAAAALLVAAGLIFGFDATFTVGAGVGYVGMLAGGIGGGVLAARHLPARQRS